MKKLFIFPILSLLISCSQSKLNQPEPVIEEISELNKKANTIFASISSIDVQGISSEMFVLGKKLYHDKALSKNYTISCSSCHNLQKYGVDNLATSPGDTKIHGNRNSPSSIYAFLHGMQFWDGRAKDVVEQAGGPILNPIEHNIPSEQFLVSRLSQIKEYQELFAAAFPQEKNPITFKNVQLAIASFEKQLNPRSKFDDYLDGNEQALSSKEKEGLGEFIAVGCVNCHNGVAVGGTMIQKFGVYNDYWKATKSKHIDYGVYGLDKNENSKYLFKVPALRNVAQTYPYFHDGSVSSLKDAIQIMAKVQLNKDLSKQQIHSIEAFLKTLTGEVEASMIQY